MNSALSALYATPKWALALIALTGTLLTAPASSAEETLLPESGVPLLESGENSPADRLAALQVLSLYAHLYDDYETETWGTLFTEDATFEIAYDGGGPKSRSIWKGRKDILSKLGPRREHFRAQRIGKRHYLANPLVYALGAKTARVSAYLLLTSVSPNGKVDFEGSGRYDGRLIKTDRGWRIQSWRFTPDGAPVDFADDL